VLVFVTVTVTVVHGRRNKVKGGMSPNNLVGVRYRECPLPDIVPRIC